MDLNESGGSERTARVGTPMDATSRYFSWVSRTFPTKSPKSLG